MAKAGDVLDNPAAGVSLKIVRSSAATGGALLEMEATYAAQSEVPPEHYHPRQDERFEVLEGALRVRLDGSERTLAKGEVLVIERGARHAMWNPDDVPARVGWQVWPALSTEAFFEDLAELARRGVLRHGGKPGLLWAAVLARRYRREIRLTRPPAFVQTIVLTLLAGVGWLLGRRAGLAGGRKSR